MMFNNVSQELSPGGEKRKLGKNAIRKRQDASKASDLR